MTRTFSPTPADVQRDWVIIDATDIVLGRLASHAAVLLRGKHKPTFAPHMDMGDFVIIINAEKVALTGSKLAQKKAYRHSGYPGGIYETNFTKLQQRFPERVLEKAVERMIPRGPLGRDQMRALHLYAGSEHPHAGTQPEPLDVASRNRKNKVGA